MQIWENVQLETDLIRLTNSLRVICVLIPLNNVGKLLRVNIRHLGNLLHVDKNIVALQMWFMQRLYSSSNIDLRLVKIHNVQ